MPKLPNERGAIPLFLLVALVALIVFLLISNTFSFKDKLFNLLYPKPSSDASEVQLEDLNKQFVNGFWSYYNSGNAIEKSKKLKALTDLAIKRKPYVLDIWSKKVSKASSLLLSDNIQAKLPKELLPYVEHPGVVQGELSIQHQDFFEKKYSRNVYILLQFQKGKIKQLTRAYFSKRPQAGIGSTIKAKARMLGGSALIDSPEAVQVLGAVNSAAGPQQTLVIPVKFNGATAEGYSNNGLRGVLDSTNNFLKQVGRESGSSVSLSGVISQNGDIVPDLVSIPSNGLEKDPDYPADCNYGNWAKQADANLPSTYDLENYSRIIYVFADRDNCNWGGMGQIGPVSATRTWIPSFETDRPDNYAHELGHNFGTQHASSMDCGASVINATPKTYSGCITQEYGDKSTVMGNSNRLNNYTIGEKVGFTWVNSNRVLTINKSGIYKLYQSSNSSAPVIALRIPKADTAQYYYLEYRLDGRAPEQKVNTNGILGYVWNARNHDRSYLVDFTANSKSNTDEDFLDPVLKPVTDGIYYSFTDPINGIKITNVSPQSDLDNGFIAVSVEMDKKFRANSLVLLGPTFESYSSGQIPADWIYATSCKGLNCNNLVTLDSSQNHTSGGSKAIKITHKPCQGDCGDWGTEVTQRLYNWGERSSANELKVKTDEIYRISAWLKSDSLSDGTLILRNSGRDEGTSTITTPIGKKWIRVEQDIVIPADRNGQVLEISCRNRTPFTTLWCDDIEVKQVYLK